MGNYNPFSIPGVPPAPDYTATRLAQALAAKAQAEAQEAEARAALAAKAEADAQQAERDAIQARIREDQRLADATICLLQRLEDLRVFRTKIPTPALQLAKYRKQLQPLAESYGARIVLIGDKTQATVVLL